MKWKIYQKIYSIPLPFFDYQVPAGFPSPAEGYLDDCLDLNDLLVARPAATFFVRVQGESMSHANIHSGDILVVDRALEAKNGDIVLAILNGDFTVKRMAKRGKRFFLLSENPHYPSIEVGEEEDFQIWGIITYVIHKTR